MCINENPDNYFESAFKAIGDKIIITDNNGIIEYVNPAFEKLTGYSREEALGKNPAILKSGKHDKIFYEDLWETVLSGKVFRAEFINKKKNGDLYYETETIAPIIDSQENITGLVSIGMDITDRKKIETDLKEAKEKAEEVNRDKSEYLAKMSHEIRTNMNAVIGMTSLLAEAGELNKDHKEYVTAVKNSAVWLQTLVNDILDFSKIEMGKLTMEMIDFDLRTTVEGVTQLLNQSAEEAGIELAGLIHSDVPFLVRGDTWKLRQILINIVSNSIKFTKSGGVLVLVSLVKEDKNSALFRFSITDTGVGISKNNIDSLFKPFSQVAASTAREYGGTGLGLSIAKQLCKLMGGDIGVESDEGKGSTFWFTANFEKQTAVVPVIPLSPEQVQGLNAFIMADKDVNLKVLSHYLQSLGCKYESALSETELLEKLRMSSGTSQPYQLVIVDFQSTDTGAENLAKTIKSDPSIQDIQLVLLTSIGKRGDAARMQEAGFAAFLTKPIKKTQLLDCVAVVMSPYRGAPGNDGKPKLVTRHSLDENAQRNRFRILMVEDNVVNQIITAKSLEKANYQVDIARNGQEALKSIKSQFYDAVIMDCQMPTMDGYKSTIEIRKLDGYPKYVPIIALTATDVSPEAREKCLESGMDDYLVKPCSPEKLRSVLNKWLSDESESDEAIPDVTNGFGLADEVFNKATALSYVEGRMELLVKLSAQFINDYPEQLSKIQKAIQNKDIKALKHAVHAIKGAVGNLCAPAAFNAAQRLERIGKEENMVHMEDAFNGLQKEIESLKQTLKADLN